MAGARLAVEAALDIRDDAELLVAAAYLHDVGYAPELALTGFHPIDGALRDDCWQAGSRD